MEMQNNVYNLEVSTRICLDGFRAKGIPLITWTGYV